MGTILQLHRGYDLPESKRENGSVPVISSSGFSGWHNTSKCSGQNVITGRYGTIGEVFYHDGECWPLNTALYVSDFKGNDPRYIYYLLKQVLKIDGKDKSTVPGVDRNVLHDMTIPFIYGAEKQSKTISILKYIDEKVEANESICSELEAVAKLLYSYWFIQFDFPDINGKPYKSSGGKMVYDDLLKRTIPEGWKGARISSIVSTKKRGDWGSDEPTSENTLCVSCIRGADMESLRYGPVATSKERFISNKHKNRILEYGDCVIEISGTPGRSTYINNSLISQFEHPVVSSNFCQVVTPIRQKMLYWFANLWEDLYTAGAADYFSGQTTMKNLQFDIMANSIKVAVPSDELLKKYHDKVSGIYEHIQSLHAENKTLICIRNWLLPMLINGQVKVAD